MPRKSVKIALITVLVLAAAGGAVFAAGITIPASSSLNVNTGTLNVAGDVTNAGTLLLTTGTITLTGNWSNAGTFTAGTETVNFTGGAGVTQTLNSGGTGTGKLFYHLTHSGAGTLQLVTNAVDIDGNFNNSAGAFDANGKAISCAGNWTNSATYTHNNNQVTLDGTNQTLTGSTTFYGLTKSVTSAATLTFDNTATQAIVNSLTLQGASGQPLSLRSDAAAAYNLTLQSGGTQALSYLDVQYSDASGGVKLVGGATSVDSGNNTNWAFDGATLTWDGSSSSDWDTAANWDLGVVPRSTDSVIIPNVTTDPVVSNSNVTIAGLTAQSGGLLTLNGKNLTLTGAIDCDGTITVTNAEILKIGGNADWTNGTFNKASGTVQFTSNANLTSAENKFNSFTIDTGVTVTAQDKIEIDGTLTTAGTGTLNLNSKDLQIATSLDLSTQTITNITNNTVTFDAASGTQTIRSNSNSFNHVAFNDAGGTATFQLADAMDVNGNFTLTDGIFDQNSKTLNVGGSWSFSGGSFASSPSVTFDSSTTAVISGSTTFNNFTCTTAGKQLTITSPTTQTISGTLTLTGTSASKVKLRSSSTGSIYTITDSGTENVSFVDVQDSTAANSITAYNSTNSGNNTNWAFNNLSITYPASGKTMGQTPTVTGVSGASETVTIKDISGNTAATTTADTSGNWRVAVSTSLAAGANSLTPYVGSVAGTGVNITVTASPTTDQVPNITSPSAGATVRGNKPTITGKGLAGQTVTLTAKDSGGNLLLTDVATATVGADGNYTISSSNYTTNLVKGTDYLTVTVDSVTSSILEVSLVDPFGVVFDSVSNNPIQGATVTIFTSAGVRCTPGVQIAAADSNPQTTGADGAYSFLTINGDFYMTISASGYAYPSAKTSFPSGRTIVTGSKAEVFTVAGAVIEMDQPMDPNSLLLKVQKDANRKEASVGDIVTYTVTIENVTASDVTGVYLEDRIPAGFKYISGRAILDGARIPDPTGTRPVTFNIGTVAKGVKKTLKYQLVVGSGVSFGKYENGVFAKYPNGTAISNGSSAIIKVVPSPIFDLGTVIGKAFWDMDEDGFQDIGEEPVPNVQVMSEDGAIITSDKYGRFHMQAIMPGRHVFRLVEGSLPKGAYLTTPKAVISDFTPGLLMKVNFGVGSKEKTQEGVGLRAKGEERGRQGGGKMDATVTVEKNRPVPRLNAGLFGDVGPASFEDGRLPRPVEFRIFTNYQAFIDRWRLAVFEKDAKTLVRSFEGGSFSLGDPIYWDGRDGVGLPIRKDRSYVYIAAVTAKDGREDTTRERPLVITPERPPAAPRIDDEEYERSRSEWIERERTINNLDSQNIHIFGETVRVKGSAGAFDPSAKAQDSSSPGIDRIRVSKAGNLLLDAPLYAGSGATAGELMKSPQLAPGKDSGEGEDMILPDGEYDVEVGETPARHIKVGGDYFFFVAMGDGKMGYTFNRGNVEPAGDDDRFQKGLWEEGRLAYNLKGKIRGKYLVTSSLDTDRRKKELFRNLDPDKYYPVYGDDSSVNWNATNTQGMLYLLIEWDRSSIMWGDYNTALTATEFGQFSRSLYGGKVDYESVSRTRFGDPAAKLVIFKALARQKAAHAEFVGTGGSLFWLPHKYVIEGSEKVKLEVRDKITGLVLKSLEQKENVDYYIKYDEARIIFWQPIVYTLGSDSIIQRKLLDGNPVYVIVDYEYDVKDKYNEGSFGGRAQAAFTDYLVAGGTYVNEELSKGNYELAAADAKLYLTKDIRVIGEYARSRSEETGSFVSTDGGLTFTSLPTSDGAEGRAYGVKGEANLFSGLGLAGYYKVIGRNFSTAATTAQQGKELAGARGTFDIWGIRLVGSYDVQKLLDEGNLQARSQVGAKETRTTMAQASYGVKRLTLTGEYRHEETVGLKEGIVSETNSKDDTAALKADYRLTDKMILSLEQQATLSGAANHQTTASVTAGFYEWLSLKAREVIGTKGTATSIGAMVNAKDAFSVAGDISRANLIEGGLQDAVTVSARMKPDNETELGLARSISDSAFGGTVASTVFSASKKISEDTKLRIERTYAESGKTDPEKVLSQSDTVGLARESGGRKLEGTVTNKYSLGRTDISNTNIFGLSGDINDKLAGSLNFEKGSVQNLNATKTERKAFAAAFGYVDRYAATDDIALKASGKFELRFDSGDTDIRQFLAYSAAEKRIGRDITLFAKANISETKNTTTGATSALYKELSAGAAYRPVYFDRLNAIGRYAFLENNAPGGQSDYMDLEKTRAHVLSAEGIYDLNERWQLSEKLALRIADEKVRGFEFTETRTWLWVNRLNYNFGKDLQIAAEYRILGQEQAKDFKQGALLEVAKKIGEFIQIGVGWNFTDFNDDLTHLDYTAHGPFVRLTGSLYDRTPEEIERARERLLEERIRSWTQELVNRELADPRSPIMREVYRSYLAAKGLEARRKLDNAKVYYKRVLKIGRMMYNEAQRYVRTRVAIEENIKRDSDLAVVYYRQGRLLEAKRLFQKIKREAEAAPIILKY